MFAHRGHAERSEEDVDVMADLVRDGHHLVVFPEGSITLAAGLRRFHLGAFAVATAVGCPVVPIGIRGTRDILRPGTALPHHGTATVLIGSAIMPDGAGFAAEADLSDRAREGVAELSGLPRLER